MNIESLTRYERVIFRTLEKRKGEVVPREDIYKELFPLQFQEGREPPKTNSLEVMIGKIRRKGCPQIRAIRGKGYMMEIKEQQA